MAGGKKKGRRGRGEGSIEELPSGKFRAVVSAGIDPATKKRRKLQETFDTKADAVAWRNEQLRRVRGGEPVEAAKLTLSEWLDAWVEIKRPNLEPLSLRWYQSAIDAHLKPRIGAVTLGKLSTDDVQRLLTGMAKDGKTAGVQFKALKTLRAALAEAVRRDKLARNVAKNVALPRVKRRRMACLDRGQARKLLEAVRGDRLATMYDVELDLGLRPGELFGLQWPDSNFAAGSLKVDRSLEEIAGNCRLKDPKTEKSRRTLPLAPRTLKSLKDHLGRMRVEGRDVEQGLVFCNTSGEFLRQSDVRRNSFVPALEAAGLPAVRFYDLRHTVATLLLEQDVNLKAVSERLGHEDTQITLRHYAHVLKGMQERATAAVDDLFGDCPTGSEEAEGIADVKC